MDDEKREAIKAARDAMQYAGDQAHRKAAEWEEAAHTEKKLRKELAALRKAEEKAWNAYREAVYGAEVPADA